uniref:VWFA domain-containing protein n=1 Tax=Plectus sambesii TaxID=2011161 RepID=A0A914VAK3_9BILA
MVDLDEMIKPKKKWGTKLLVTLLIVLIIIIVALIIVVIILLAKKCDKCANCYESSPPCGSDTVEPLYFTLLSTKVNYADTVNGNYTNAIQILSNQIHDALTDSAVRSGSEAFTNFDGSNSNILPVAILGISPSPTGYGVAVIGSTIVIGQNLLSPRDAINRLTSHNLTAYVIKSQFIFASTNANTVVHNDNFHATGSDYVDSYVTNINTRSELPDLYKFPTTNTLPNNNSHNSNSYENNFTFLLHLIYCHTAIFFFFFFNTINFATFVNVNDFAFIFIVSNSINNNIVISRFSIFKLIVDVNIICNSSKLIIINTIYIHFFSYFDFDDSNNNMLPSTNTKGLQTIINLLNGQQQPCVKQVTVVFASTSDLDDVAAAKPFAKQLQALGPVIFVAMGPNANSVILSSLATPGPFISWTDYNDTAADVGTVDRLCYARRVIQKINSASSFASLGMTEFKQTSRSNKLLLGGLGAVLVLVIAAIVLLAITLGKTSNLNAVQVAPSSSPTPQSQPCNQKTVQPYYFTVESNEVSYDNVTNDYAGAASRLKQQIENALNTVAMTRAADGVYNLVLDASGSNYLPVAILGISNTSTGGVSVIASTVFVGTNLPTSQAVSNALNTTGFSAPTVSNGTMSSNSSNMQMCQNVNANPSGGTPPTLPPITTSIPSNYVHNDLRAFFINFSSYVANNDLRAFFINFSSYYANNDLRAFFINFSSYYANNDLRAFFINFSSYYANNDLRAFFINFSSYYANNDLRAFFINFSSYYANNDLRAFFINFSSYYANNDLPPTSPTTTPVSTTTTLPPSYPCMRDVLILVDISIGLRTRTNFDDQILFISAALISSGWTVSTLQLEANPVAYDKYTYIPQGSFEYGSAKELKDAVEDMQWFQDAPSIAYGLQKVAKDSILGWRAGVPRVVLLFTSTSDPTDVAQAQQYSDQLKNNNHTIIVVGMGPSANQTILSQLASGTNNTFATDFGVLPTDNFLAAQLNAAICGFVPPPPPSTTITPPSPSSSPTSPATSVSTSTPTSTYPCMRDILILMDNSIGLQNKDNYLYQVMFISLTLINGWTVSPSQVEANPAVYSGNLHNFLQLGSFSFENVDELRHATNAAATLFGANDPPSIKVGLQAATMNKEVNGWRRGVPKVTLLFTSSSDPADVTAALPYAAQLKSNGSSLIVVGMGPHVTASILSPIASGSNFLFTQPYYNVFLNDTTLANQINNAICATPPTTTPGPTTMPTTTPVSTTTTLPPSYPCMRDILILVDVSIGLRSQTNFDDQILFISAALISSGWTVSTLQLEANPVAYEKGNYVPQGSFGYDSAEELKETLETMQWFQDDPSIAYGLKELASDTNLGWRAGVPRVVLLFTSTSDPADVAQAQQYSNQLKNNNHTIIVVGMGPSANQTILSQLASGAGNTFATDFNVLPTDTALAAQLNAAICGFAPPPPPSTTVMPTSSSSIATSTLPSSSTTSVPTSTLPPTTPTMSTVSTTLPSSYPCMRDVLILVDFSIGLRSQTNFDDQLLFISAALISSGWTVSTLQLEANPVAYDKGGYVVQGSFGYDNAQELKEAVEAMQWSQDDAPSIAYGLQEVAKDPNLGWRAGVPRVVLLFTSTSEEIDIFVEREYGEIE